MKIIAGLFDSLEAAEQAKTALVQAGVAQGRPCVSRSLTEDAVAAEAPGQSYENQTGEDPDTAKFGEAVRSAVCVVSVKVDSRHQAALAAALLRRHGARGGVLRFPRSREC
jgi:hypothetical protein